MKTGLITPIRECTGIYGIYVDDNLVYIGKTTQTFEKRFLQHKRLMDFPDDSETQYDMYYELAAERAKGSCIQLRPLIIAEYVPYDSLYTLTNRDLESMELALIWCYRPRYNICGIKKPYKYTHEPKIFWTTFDKRIIVIFIYT